MALTKIADISQQMLDIYSRLLLMDAMPLLQFRQFIDYKADFGLQPGERMMFTKLDNLDEGGKLVDEDTPIQKNKMTGSNEYISMAEFGNAASFSRRASVASLIPMMESARKVLARDYAIVMDKYLRDVFQTTANKFYAVKSDYTSGAAIGSVDGLFTSTCIDSLVETANELNFPKLTRGGDSFFAFIGTPHQIRQMRASYGWLDARKYVDPSQMLNGEAGRLNDVVFLQSTHMQSTASSGSGSCRTHRGMFIGGGPAVGYGESVPVELIPDTVEDFGRKQSIAWYSIAGAGILNDYLIDVYTAEGLVTAGTI
jgi:N4-gp56 family major capsid protein